MHTLSDKENEIVEALKKVYDPEIPVNIYDMGLIYDVTENDGDVKVLMSLTAPNCPEAERMPEIVKNTLVMNIPDLKSVNVEVTFEPAWQSSMMSDEAKIAMDMLF